MARSTALAARGELRAAESELAALGPACVAADDMIHLHMASRSRSMLQLMAPWLARRRPEHPDTSLSATISSGLARARRVTGPGRARAWRAFVRSRSGRA
jgi:hypothetical protein